MHAYLDLLYAYLYVFNLLLIDKHVYQAVFSWFSL